MDTVSLNYAILIAASAILWWATRKTKFGSLAFLAGGAAFFTSPVWLPILYKSDVPAVAAPPPVPALQLWMPAICFAATLLIAEIARATRKALVPVILLTLLLVTAKILSAPFGASGFPSTLAKTAIGFGLSYYILRAIAGVMEVSRGNVKDLRALDFAGYLAFPPILGLGPIERLSSFVRECRRDTGLLEAAGGALAGAGRIGEGLFKSLILGEAVRKFADIYLSGAMAPAEFERGAMIGGIFAYAFYIYINFSGASDIAIGASRIFGIKVTENFDIPYARPNITEFWRAWHISLSTWLRDFLFFPIGRRLPREITPFVAPLIVMALCGLWHGVTPAFLVWGLLHGAGLAVHQAWLRARRSSEGLDRAAGSIVGQIAGTILTVFYVTFAWIFFAASSLETALVHIKMAALDAMAAPWIPGIAAAVAALWCFAPRVREWLRAKAASVNITLLSQIALSWRANVDVICILVVVARFLLAKTAPEGGFVYNNF